MAFRPISDVPSRFLLLATAFEGILLLAAFLLGWVLSIDPLDAWSPGLSATAWGVAGIAPLYAVFLLGYRHPHRGMRVIREFLIDRLGPLLAGCRVLDLLYLAMLAGVAEEFLFRGVLQPWLERDWGFLGGLIFSNLIFALAHWVTPLYGLLAGVTGAYLGLSLDVAGERNLAIPTIIHAGYDFLAFLAVARSYRQLAAGS